MKKLPGKKVSRPPTGAAGWVIKLAHFPYDWRRAKAVLGRERGHWGVDPRNHYQRDVSRWQEVEHRQRRPRSALNLALPRNALLALLPFAPGEPLDQYLNPYHSHPAHARNLLLCARPVL